MAGSPASRLECLMIWGGAEVILIGIKCPINAIRLNHPETILLPLVREIIVFHETCPGCQEGWGFLLWDEDYQFTRQTWTSLVFRCKDLCHWGTLLTARPTPCSLLGSGVSSVSAESLTTLCDPCDPCQASLSMTFPRQEYWSGLPFPSPGDLPDPGIEPTSPVFPAVAGGFSTTGPPGKSHEFLFVRKTTSHVLSVLAVEETWPGVSGTLTSSLRFKFRFRIQLILSAREDKRAKTEGKYPCDSHVFIYFKKSYLGSQRLHFFLIHCRALAWTLLYKIHRAGMLLEKWKSSEGM